MNIKEMHPKDLFEPSWLATYEQYIEVLYRQLVRLNSSIFVLEKVLSFPFDLFKPYSRPFWNLVTNALFETCILAIWRVAVDSSDAGLTLRQLKNEVFQHFCQGEYKQHFAGVLQNATFEEAISALQPKIITLRHNHIAHFNLAANVNPTPEQNKQRVLLFSELTKYRDAVNSFFDLLCFAHKQSLLPLDYHSDVIHPGDTRSDIEQLLDCVARESIVLNLPEENPQHWEAFRKNLSEDDVKKLNQYRAKFGLPEV